MDSNYWVKIEDDLPTNADDVLICFDGDYIAIGEYKNGKWAWYGPARGNITHWRLLPEYPKKK